MLINELQAKQLKKAQLIEILSSDELFASLKKSDLLIFLLSQLNENELLQKKIIKKFPKLFALHPNTLEELLGITKTERIRWTKERRLPVVCYEPFKRWGQTLQYPLYDYYETIEILHKNKVEQWRKQHKEKVYKNRKAALQVRAMHDTKTEDINIYST